MNNKSSHDFLIFSRATTQRLEVELVSGLEVPDSSILQCTKASGPIEANYL